MQNRILLLFIIAFFTISCNEHTKKTVVLQKSIISTPVHYQTDLVDFYFEKEDLIRYCIKEDKGDINDFTFAQILDYINSYDNIPIFIPDTLGTKMVINSDFPFIESDSLIRVRDQNHPYAYITSDIRWAIIEFAENGKLKVYERSTKKWIDTIIVVKVDTYWYGKTYITQTNDSIIFRQLRWIK